MCIRDRDKDLLFKGDDGGSVITALTFDMSEAGAATFNSTVQATGFNIGGTAITSTAAEINLIDGGTSRGTTAVADADGILHNDGGTMRMTSAATFKTYFQSGLSTSSAADDITAGDAAVTITTSSGDITIDAAANDTDIIFKGTDGGADTTFLTIDGSAAGAATFNNKVVATELDISGDIDVDGTTNLDVVDIDGAVDMASTLGVTGVVTANAGVVVDNITIDGTEIDLSSGDLTVDVAGDITLDAGGGDIRFDAGGSEYGKINLSGNNLNIHSSINDADIVFKGEDNSSTITALTLDMSAAGAATFNAGATFGGALLPAADDTHDLGSSSKQWRDIYTGDINLNNTKTRDNEVDGSRGSWTIQEGSDDLFLLNRLNGKKYKFNLTEV